MKMTAKKRWLNKIYHDSQELYESTQGNIIWSSSESSDDEANKTKGRRKKKKITRTNVSSSWIKPNKLQEYENRSPTNKFKEIDSSEVDQLLTYPTQRPGISDLNKKHCSVERTYAESNIESNILSVQSCESPIINDIKLEELSPVLNQNSGDTNKTQEVSPILCKKGLLRKVRSKYKKGYKVAQKVFKIPAVSPDLFPDQSTQIIEYDSPEFYTEYNSQSTECIDPFPSQCSSQVINSDGDSTLLKADNSSLYHHPAARKRNFKKGGLALLLQKVLHLQKTRTAIWQHEMYTNKTDNLINIDEVIEFIIKKKWKEYGSILLECEALDNKLNSSRGSEDKTKDFFIIVIGFSAPLNISYKVDCRYKLFPPYSIKTIKYKSVDISCYFNVTKLILLKDGDTLTKDHVNVLNS